MENLKERWKIFFNLILDPFTLVLFLSSAILVYLASSQTSTEFKAVLTILTSIASAILGSRIMTVWVNETEGRVLIARGKTAIRNLSLLLKNVSILEQRVSIYLKNISSARLPAQVIKTYFEEIIEKFHIIEEESMNSIEDWKDIIPEANIKNQIGLITDLKIEINEKSVQLEALTKKLEETKDRSKSEKKELREEIENKQAEIYDLGHKLRKNTLKLNTPILTASSILDSPSMGSYLSMSPFNLDNFKIESTQMWDGAISAATKSILSQDNPDEEKNNIKDDDDVDNK